MGRIIMLLCWTDKLPIFIRL